MDNLVATIGQPVRKHEIFRPLKIFKAPNGDTIADFGQNMAGWVKVTVKGKSGDTLRLNYAEVLDKAGNIVAQVGDNPDAKQRANYGLPPDQWKDGICNSPHGAAIDKQGNLIVTEWSKFGHLHKFSREILP